MSHKEWIVTVVDIEQLRCQVRKK